MRMFLTVSDLIKLNGYSSSAASREMQFLRDILDKKRLKTFYQKKYQKVTIKEYCELMDIPENEIRKTLKL